ncbi:MAG: response regulator transcription factor [Bacteroidia bacterium]
MLKVLITDDHSVIRNGVRQILLTEFTEMECEEAENAAVALRKIQDTKWDIIILDIDMPGRSGLDVLKDMKDNAINIPVLVFSLHPEDQIALRAFKMGAYGYLSKDSVNEELIKAVKQILAGKKYITPSIAEKLVLQLENPNDKEPHEILSDREYQTLLLFANGKTVSQIAQELSLSVPTVSTYRARILEKMNMKNTAELVNYAIKKNLV